MLVHAVGLTRPEHLAFTGLRVRAAMRLLTSVVRLFGPGAAVLRRWFRRELHGLIDAYAISRYHSDVLRVLVGVSVGMWSAVAVAKSHPPQVTQSHLAAAGLVDGIELPAGALVTRQAEWDEAVNQYRASTMTEFRLTRAATVCATQLPAGLPISVRHGLPAAVELARAPASSATHLVWTTRRATRIGSRGIRAGDTVGVECPSGAMTLLASERSFDVERLHVDAALWYPADLGARLLRVQLRSPAEIGGIRVPAGFAVTFALDGAPATLLGPPTSAVVVGDKVCWTWQLGSEIRIDRDQTKCVEATMDGARCNAHEEIQLHDGAAAGHLARCVLAAPFTANGHTWSTGATLRLDRDGNALAN